jgi:hypothetical protein
MTTGTKLAAGAGVALAVVVGSQVIRPKAPAPRTVPADSATRSFMTTARMPASKETEAAMVVADSGRFCLEAYRADTIAARDCIWLIGQVDTVRDTVKAPPVDTVKPPADTAKAPRHDSQPPRDSVLPPRVAGKGITVGASSMPSTGNPGVLVGGLVGVTPNNILSALKELRTQGRRDVRLNATGGAHTQYLTGGKFDMAKWTAKMDGYNTAAIKQAVASAVTEGLVSGNSVMDEPFHPSWGGNVTKTMVDQMCGRVKAIFPTLPVGVVHDPDDFEPTKSYRVCDFMLAQYRLAKGDVKKFRDDGLALARRDGMRAGFSLNILHGGTPSTSCPKYGEDASGKLCPMSPEQVKAFGLVLGPAGCGGLNLWRYEAAVMNDPKYQAAFKAVSDSLKKIPAKSCKRAA